MKQEINQALRQPTGEQWTESRWSWECSSEQTQLQKQSSPPARWLSQSFFTQHHFLSKYNIVGLDSSLTQGGHHLSPAMSMTCFEQQALMVFDGSPIPALPLSPSQTQLHPQLLLASYRPSSLSSLCPGQGSDIKDLKIKDQNKAHIKEHYKGSG